MGYSVIVRVVMAYGGYYEMAYYLIKVKSVFDLEADNPAYNMFTYVSDEPTATLLGAQSLGDAFGDRMWNDTDVWPEIVNTRTLITGVEVTAPQVPSVLYINSSGAVGLTVGDYMPRFVAAEFISPRTVGNIRAGFKRFGLISEANVIDGEPEDTFLPFLSAMAVAMSEEFTFTISGTERTFTPAIIKRIPYVTPGGNDAYRLPEAGDPVVYSEATNWTFQRITTQNSRKR